ncbi:hypothetical protein GUJ93_ZPchr0013g34857 [Zizania palustris]|uniref:Uncharacterized protein n=1 Tax=Zizania palustris TaxID=103762 RepID=A0A8J5X0R0_ZIZPA|nr:hypothetical protein GUJ93_ZPchr0013g34857 [Zizania palustris]
MRRHGSEASPSIVHTSSIALLQERFRNLQRVKEMREGREVMKAPVPSADAHHHDHRAAAGSASSSALSLSLQAAANGSNEQPRWFLHPDLVRPSRPLHGPSYHGALQGGGGGGSGGRGGVQASLPSTPSTTSSWGELPRTTQNSGFRGDVDVDTSLHL